MMSVLWDNLCGMISVLKRFHKFFLFKRGGFYGLHAYHHTDFILLVRAVHH